MQFGGRLPSNTSDPEKGIRRAQRSPGRVAIPSAVAAAAVLIAGVAIALPRGGGDGGTSSAESAAYAMAGALQPFDTCDSVLAYFKDQAPEYLIQRVGGAVEQNHRRRRIGGRTYGT